MWLATKHGFYSIVEKAPGEFHIRARTRRDLENLADLLQIDSPVLATPSGDYAWRLVVDRPTVARAATALANAIDYTNFKARIQTLPDQREKTSAYERLWAALYDLQSRAKKG